MEEYKQALKRTLYGFSSSSGRNNMPDVIVNPHTYIVFDFENGLPILTGKKMPFYSILGELICFMKGVTDVREFSKLGCNVWWDNAYKWNIQEAELSISLGEYKEGKLNDKFYDLGKIYSYQWRKYNGHKDQLVDMIHNMNINPTNRYHVMSAWNPSDMNNDDVSQPNCHVYFQSTIVKSYKDELFKNRGRRVLDNLFTNNTLTNLELNGYKPNGLLFTHLTQRSADMFLGVPFNITSYALLTIFLSIFTNNYPFEFSWLGVNTHIYKNHLDQVDTYMNRKLFNFPKLELNVFTLKDLLAINTLTELKQAIKLIDYQSGNKIKAPLSVGLK